MSGAVDTAISRLAGRQRGYVTRGQLLALGLSPDAVDYRLKIGRLIRVHNGVYAVGHLPISGPDRAYAAVLACGPGAVLSHGTAASLWGIDDRWRTPSR
jgi:putative AbiEi antitoxin of type IV toxin-antitoxin system